MKSDSFAKKITSCFLVKSKKMSLNQIAKNGPKTQFQQKWHFFYFNQKETKANFSQKN